MRLHDHAVRPAPPAARAVLRQLPHPPDGGAHGAERARAGHRRRHLQAGDDRPRPRARSARSSRAAWCSPSTTSSCSRCRSASASAVEPLVRERDGATRPSCGSRSWSTSGSAPTGPTRSSRFGAVHPARAVPADETRRGGIDRPRAARVAWVLSGATGVARRDPGRDAARRGTAEHAFFTSGRLAVLPAHRARPVRRRATVSRPIDAGSARFRTATAGSGLPAARRGCWRSAGPAWSGWTLIAINLVALTAIPGLAAVLLADHRRAAGRRPRSCSSLPAFVLLYGNVVRRSAPHRAAARSRTSSTAAAHRRPALVRARVRDPREGDRGRSRSFRWLWRALAAP